MYKLIDKTNGVIHQMNEDHVKEYVRDILGVIEVNDMTIEEIQDVLHYHNYSLKRSS